MPARHDPLIPVARRIIENLAGKPGTHFADKQMAADYLAQSLWNALKRGDLQHAIEKTDLH